jgi:hypothetical protein
VQFDFVVLHIHPYDVVPTLAFAHCDSTPPVILENHADHCFWLGLSVANLLTDHRESAQRITAERRGVPPSHMGWLPLPIEVLQAGPSRAEARQALGIPDDMVLGVSIANAFKSQPLRGPGLAEALIPVAAQHPNFTAMVVGPSPKDSRWQAAQRETGNRVRALGVVTDPQNLVRAADIYLDSSPVGSGTSILEAALASLPPVSLFRFEGHARIFGSNSPGLAQGHTTVTTIEDYVDVLGQLICDPTERRRRGTLVSQSVQHVHCGDECNRFKMCIAGTNGAMPLRRSTNKPWIFGRLDWRPTHTLPTKRMTLTSCSSSTTSWEASACLSLTFCLSNCQSSTMGLPMP